MNKKELRCHKCQKLLAHWNEKEKCSYTDVPCGEGFYYDSDKNEGWCDKCSDKYLKD